MKGGECLEFSVENPREGPPPRRGSGGAPRLAPLAFPFLLLLCMIPLHGGFRIAAASSPGQGEQAGEPVALPRDRSPQAVAASEDPAACLDALERALGEMSARRRSFWPRWDRRSRVSALIARAERVRLSEIFTRRIERELVSGERRVQPAVTSREVEKFHQLWDALLIKKLDIEKSGHVRDFEDWMRRIVHAKYPPITAAILESDFPGATVRDVFELYWDASLGDPDSDRMLMSVLDMTPIELRQSLRRRGGRMMAFGAGASGSAVVGLFADNLGGNDLASWAQDKVSEGWYAITRRLRERQRRRILARIARITREVRKTDFVHMRRVDARELWDGENGFFARYAREFRKWNSLDPSPLGQNQGEWEKVRHGAWTTLALAMNQYQAAQLALANPEAMANKTHDPVELRRNLDKSVEEFAKDLANWEFILISQDSAKGGGPGGASDNPTAIARKENEENANSTSANIFNDLAKMRYLTHSRRTPFQDFTNYFVREISSMGSGNAPVR